MLWFEKKFLSPSDIEDGPLKPNTLNRLTTLFFCLFLASLCLSPPAALPQTMVLALLALVFARLMALDLTALVLPDVYTLPLLALGLFAPFLLGWHTNWHTALTGAGLGLTLSFGFALLAEKLTNANSGLGGGDIKLIAAAGAWLGPFLLLFYIPAGVLLALVFSLFLKDAKNIPFGPALCVILWGIFLFYPKLLGLLL